MVDVAQQERARCEGILTCPEAADRPSAARVVAFGTELNVAAARRLLAALPSENEPSDPVAAFWDDIREEFK